MTFKILVCVKQVLDPETNIKPDEDHRWIACDHEPRYQLNYYDEFALEEAVLLKERIPGAEVHVASAGPERVLAVIQRGVGMGADHGIRIESGENEHPLATASSLAVVAVDQYDLILTGVMSEDLMQGQVGPLIAEIASMPFASSVICIKDVDVPKGLILVEREIEGGRREIVELKTPAVISVQSGINKPRYPTLSGMLRAKKLEVGLVESDGNKLNGECFRVIKSSFPKRTRNGVLLEGDDFQKAEQLVAILKEKAFLA